VEIYVGSITKDSLVPIGLVPGMYNSGESEKCLGITPSRSQLQLGKRWIPRDRCRHQGKNVKCHYNAWRRIFSLKQTAYQIRNLVIASR
jgi:hypothetical protein